MDKLSDIIVDYESTDFNWEVLLRTDEAIYNTLYALRDNNKIQLGDTSFFISLIEFYNNVRIQSYRQKKGEPKYSIKQSQSVIVSLAKRYRDALKDMYYTDNHFNKYINSIAIKDEEVLEIVDCIPVSLDCPVCINKNKLTIPAAGNVFLNLVTIKCDHCHTTITFKTL